MSGLLVEKNKQERSMYNTLNLVNPSTSSIPPHSLVMVVNLIHTVRIPRHHNLLKNSSLPSLPAAFAVLTYP